MGDSAGVSMVMVMFGLLGCGGNQHNSTDGGAVDTSIDTSGGDGAAGAPGWTVSYGLPAIMFGQITSTIYRFQDANGDGDYNESTERAVFFQDSDVNAKPMVAIDHSTIIGIINNLSSLPNTGAIRWLQDLNNNGTALDPGESHVWWSGAVPGGGTAGALAGIARTADGAVYVVEAYRSPAASNIYKLVDANNNGTANDAGEVTLVGQVPAGVIVDTIAVDGYGDVWFVGDATGGHGDLYRVQSNTASMVFDHTTLAAASINIDSEMAATLADGSIVVKGNTGGNTFETGALFGLKDANADHRIELAEVQPVWSLADGDFSWSTAQLYALEDGSLLGIGGQGSTLRAVDGNQDGTFFDDGETNVNYDTVFAAANGQMQPASMSEIAASTR